MPGLPVVEGAAASWKVVHCTPIRPALAPQPNPQPWHSGTSIAVHCRCAPTHELTIKQKALGYASTKRNERSRILEESDQLLQLAFRV